MPHEIWAREEQQLGIGALGLATPTFELLADPNVLGHQRVVKGVDVRVFDEHVAPTGLVLELLHVLTQPLIVAHELPVGNELGVDQYLSDEDLTCSRWVDWTKCNAPA